MVGVGGGVGVRGSVENEVVVWLVGFFFRGENGFGGFWLARGLGEVY